MPKPKPTKDRSSGRIAEVDKELQSAVKQWSSLRSGVPCYPMLMTEAGIRNGLVDDVYDELRTGYAKRETLDVIVDSPGGDIDAAYNLALLFRRWGTKRLEFIVPRWAKSAATLVVCAGDRILMTPVAELGPVDPQIRTWNPLEKRLEEFSPLQIDSALQLIRDEYESGNPHLAEALVKRLQFPLTLLRYKDSLKIGKGYLRKLLSTRMLKKKPDKVTTAVEKLTEGYADHSYCIDVQEALTVGLVAEELDAKQLEAAWRIHQLSRERRKLEAERKRKKIQERLKRISPELLEQLPEIFGAES